MDASQLQFRKDVVLTSLENRALLARSVRFQVLKASPNVSLSSSVGAVYDRPFFLKVQIREIHDERRAVTDRPYRRRKAHI